MREQKQLKDIKVDLKEKLHYFIMYNSLKECVGHVAKNIQNRELIDILDNLDRGIQYFTSHVLLLYSYSTYDFSTYCFFLG